MENLGTYENRKGEERMEYYLNKIIILEPAASTLFSPNQCKYLWIFLSIYIMSQCILPFAILRSIVAGVFIHVHS